MGALLNKARQITGTQDESPEDIGQMLDDAALKYGVDPALVRAMADQESGLHPRRVSSAGAVGVMQLMPNTAAQYGDVDLTDPRQNIDTGVRYFSEQMRQFNNDPQMALAAYNAGPGAVTKAGGIPQNDETPAYVSSIMAKYKPSSKLDLARQISQRHKGKQAPLDLNYRNLNAEQRQMLRQEVERRIEAGQKYPIARAAQESMPAAVHQPTTTEERFLSRAGEFAGVPGAKEIGYAWDFWTGNSPETAGKWKALGVGLKEMGAGIVGMHVGYAKEAAQAAAEGRPGEAVRNLIGVVPAIGPGTAEAIRMYGEGDWAGGTGALFGTYILAPVAIGGPGKLVSKMVRPPWGTRTILPTASAMESEGRLTAALRREHVRQGAMGVATKEAEFPAELGQTVGEAPRMVEDIGPFKAEQLTKPSKPGAAGTLGSFRQSMQAAATTTPEVSAVQEAVNAREFRIRDVVSRTSASILSALDDATAWTKEKLGMGLRAEVGGTLAEHEAEQTAAVRRAAGLPEMPMRPEAMTELGERVKSMPQMRDITEQRAAELVATRGEALGEGKFLSNAATPEDAANLTISSVLEEFKPLEFEKGVVVGGGKSRLLEHEAFEKFKEDVPTVPGTQSIDLSPIGAALNKLRPSDAEVNSIMDAIRGPLRGVVENFRAFTKATKKRGLTTPRANWLDLYEGYKSLGEFEAKLPRGSQILEKTEKVRQAVKNTLTQSLEDAGAPDLAETFTDLTNNTARVRAAMRGSVAAGILNSKNPLVGRHLVDSIINTKGNVVRKLDGLWNTLTTHWDPSISDTRQAAASINALKRSTWNRIVELSSESKGGALGERVINWDKVVDQLQTKPRWKELLDYEGPGQSLPIPKPHERLLDYAKSQARSAADPLHEAQMMDLLKSVKTAPREKLIDNLAHDWGLDNAKMMREVLDSSPDLLDLDRQLRLGVLESVYRKAASSDNPKLVDLRQLQKTLINRQQQLEALLPGDRGGLGITELSKYVDGQLQLGKKFVDSMDFLRKQVLDNPDPEAILGGILENKDLHSWTKLVKRVRHDKAFVRQMVNASFNHLVESSTFNPTTSKFGYTPQGPGVAGTGSMTYTVGPRFYEQYKVHRPKLVELLKELPDGTAILNDFDALANTAKFHLTTIAALQARGFTKALASLTSYTQPVAAAGGVLTTGNVSGLVAALTKLGMRWGIARHMMKPAASPFVERGAVLSSVRAARSNLMQTLSSLSKVDRDLVFRMANRLVPVETRKLLYDLERGKGEWGEDYLPANLLPGAAPIQMPQRPAVMSEAREPR